MPGGVVHPTGAIVVIDRRVEAITTLAFAGPSFATVLQVQFAQIMVCVFPLCPGPSRQIRVIDNSTLISMKLNRLQVGLGFHRYVSL